MPPFELVSNFLPTGDQPDAINKLVEGVNKGQKNQVLLGATGTGKTFTIANIIQQTQRPALIMAHNKTLAAQLYAEFKDFFPKNAVEYFVSYYDYYQPEAYVPRHDLYIEKETQINEEIERLRLAATTSLLSRRDVIIVASVSCIYGLGSPEAYGKVVINLRKGENVRRNTLLRRLVEIHYTRNDVELKLGTFRVRGDTLEVMPAYQDIVHRIELFGDDIERILDIDSMTGEILAERDTLDIFPARHFITEEEKLKKAIAGIDAELEERIKFFKEHEKYLEGQRIEQRTRYDLEMLREVGYCSGIENYSRHMDQRAPGSPPWTLIDYLPTDYLLIIDESHMTVPQIRGMFGGDRSRKNVLVEFGFRLPSAVDNRPLSFEEFEERMGHTIYTSATPGPYEFEKTPKEWVAQQIIRPTGLVDPEVDIRPTKGQVDDLVKEIKKRVDVGQRVLVTTLTKKMSENLADYLLELGIKVHYLHSEVETLERIEILRDLRLGVFDVVVGINLLREGLDLPEVSLVAILDADKEGFLRSRTSLLQTIGRAARHLNGKVIMYADKMTDSMKDAIEETNRRRTIQVQYNKDHHIVPATIVKGVRDITERIRSAAVAENRAEYNVLPPAQLPKRELATMIKELEKQMKEAAQALEFEKAALLRDEIMELRQALVEKDDAPAWQKDLMLAELEKE
jgi:excinuclease ABC subunit B